jgi:DNA-binding NtrC family response regulator
MDRTQNALRVFAVDDEPTIAWSMARILRSQGYDASAFTNPEEALHAAQSDRPDLLLSDVAMPRLSGIDLAIQVRRLYPACKILLITGQAGTPNLLDEAREQGHPFELLAKPVHPENLLFKIRRAFALAS